METRQIAYFLAACQQQNHALAAKEPGIAPSTLSQNIADLEQELGLELFRLGHAGFYPTLEARALYQDFEHALRAAESAVAYARSPREGGLKEIRVSSTLKFALGRVSKSAGLAARALIRKFPDTVFDIAFALHDPSPAIQQTRQGAKRTDDIVIEYAGSPESKKSIRIATDSWFAVTGLAVPKFAKPEDALDILRRLPLALPQLPDRVVAAATSFCRDHGLPAPHHLNEDIGGLPRLARNGDPFCLLVPQSILSSRLKQLRISVIPLPKALSSPITARIYTSHPAAREFVDHMRAALTRVEANNIYRPVMSLKQIRYFQSLHEHRNMTRAAKALSVAQPALSFLLKKLETTVGARLFERHRDGLTSSAAANRLATVLHRVHGRIDLAIRKASGLTASQRHRVTLGIVPLAERRGVLVESLTAAVSEWQATHEGIDLRIREAPTEALHKLINSGVINLALVETVMPHSSRIDLRSRDPLGLVTSSEAPFLPSGDVAFASIAEIPLLLPSREFGIRRLLDEAAGKAGVRLRIQAEVNSLMMALAMIGDGRCATVMPYATVRKAVSEGEMQFRKLVEPEVWRKLSVIYSAERSLTEIERSLVRLFRRHLTLHAQER
ncbi:MAG: LysR family transcriptional regulator [Pseudorhodoplanes sp.]|uniref:LysR family transcriptional regulator n=1 Tax=Pseudorhodoplanes sp. TaxID=1934341 RepID=UPI003D0F3BC6